MLELVLCTLIWGASFVAQNLGSEHFGPFTVICSRELLAAAFLFACVRMRKRTGGWDRTTIVGGASFSRSCYRFVVRARVSYNRNKERR